MGLKEDKELITYKYFESINLSNIELFAFIKDNFTEVETIFPLVEFIISRLSTVTELAVQGNNWDAEIIYRSALECFVKLVFIISGEGQERKKRLTEYWEDLCDVNLIKQSEQAKKVLKIYGDDENLRLTFIPMVLSEEDETRLRAKWTKVERQKLEQKWSFSEMIVSMSKNYMGTPEPTFIGLGHNYRYASHVTHADETGVLIIKEREQRPDEERELADFAHYFKLMSDSFNFCIFLAIQIVKFTNKDKESKIFYDLKNSMNEFYEIGNKYVNRLKDDSSYDKFRKE